MLEKIGLSSVGRGLCAQIPRASAVVLAGSRPCLRPAPMGSRWCGECWAQRNRCPSQRALRATWKGFMKRD